MSQACTQFGKHKNTPFLMVTAEATRENIIEAIGAGGSIETIDLQ